jgi:hypothetical protein
MTAVLTSAPTTTTNTFKPNVRILEVPLKRELSVKSGDSMKTGPWRSAVGALMHFKTPSQAGHIHGRAPCVPTLGAVGGCSLVMQH